jgi:spore coat protein CotF
MKNNNNVPNEVFKGASSAVPIIKPHKSAEYEFKQSKYDVAPRIPFSQIVVGPSGSRKSILLQNMILDIYRGCFERVFIFSASIHVDSVWHPVKEYIEKTLKVNPKKEKVYFDEFHKEDLEEVLEQQYKISQYQKDHKFKKLFATLVVVDDFVDQVSFSKHNSMLNALYIRGRHFGVNVVSSSQKFNSLSTIIRVNSRQLYFFKMRNYKEIQTMVEELSALLIKRNFLEDKNIHNAKNTLLEIYEKATEEKFSFLFVNLMESNINDIFKIRFYRKIIVDDAI